MKAQLLRAVCWGWLILTAAGALAAPAISNISLRGLRAGGTTSLAIDGTELGPDTRIVLEVPIAAQMAKPGAGAGRVEIDITLDAQVTPGIYQLRVAGPTGISNAVPIGIDALPQL